MAKTWFITGASKGFGREWTEAALERGDKVAASARNLETLEALVDTYGDAVFPIQLDVTDRVADFEAVKQAADVLGKLDVGRKFIVDDVRGPQRANTERIDDRLVISCPSHQPSPPGTR